MLFFGFLYGIPYGINATSMTESFSTKVCETAVGRAYNVGRLGAVLAPLTIGYFAQGDSIGTGLLIMSITYFVCGLFWQFSLKTGYLIHIKQVNPHITTYR